jgi:hypothetical protein
MTTILSLPLLTQGILTSGPNISFSTSSRAGTIMTPTTSFSGPLEVCASSAIVSSTACHTGPGCSSSLGLFMELGPCRVVDENSTAVHSEAWNNNANIFFVDQPIGVGFSYAEHGHAVRALCYGMMGSQIQLGNDRGGSEGYCQFCSHFLRALHQVQRPRLPYGWRILWCTCLHAYLCVHLADSESRGDTCQFLRPKSTIKTLG